MKKIAIIVQRFGRNILGGSEGYAFNMAMVLKERFQVDIITSTARDHITWKPFYPEGISCEDGVRVIRYDSDFERSYYWHELNRIMLRKKTLRQFSDLYAEERDNFISGLRRTPAGFSEEFIKWMGPYPGGFFDHLRLHSSQYDYIVFMTYLYPSTYFGIDHISAQGEKVFVCPTFHDEPYAYLPNFRKYLDYRFLFLSAPEKNLAQTIFGAALPDSHVIGFGLENQFPETAPAESSKKYILYAGRLDEAKGVGKLIEFWRKFIRKNPGTELELGLIGDGPLKMQAKGRQIKYLGFVSEEEKLKLMRDATAFVHPSAYESLGIVLLESFMMGTPALVNRRSAVLESHIADSGAGFSYYGYDEFEASLRRMIQDSELIQNQRVSARVYYEKNYSLEAYKRKLFSIFMPL